MTTATATERDPVQPPAPFSPAADAADFWQGPAHHELLSGLRRAVRERLGVLVLTGDAGCGKTILVKALVDTLRHEGAIVATVPDSRASAADVRQAVADGFRLTVDLANRAAFTSAVWKLLADARTAVRSVLLVVDDAQHLSHEALAEIAELPLGGRGAEPGLTVLLVGQEALRATLREPQHAELTRAVDVACRLDALAPDDVAGYVRHQLRRGRGEQPAFEADAVREIAGATRGNAQLVNTLGGAVVGVARREGVKVVRAKLVRQCAVDLAAGAHIGRAEWPSRRRAAPPRPLRRYALVAAGITAVAVVSFAVTGYVMMRQPVETPGAVAVPPPPAAASVTHRAEPPVVAPATRAESPAPEPAPERVAAPSPSASTPSVPATTAAPAITAAPPRRARARTPAARPAPAPPRLEAPQPRSVARPLASAPAPTGPPREPDAPAVSARRESPSSEPDPSAIIDWMLTNSPGRRMAAPDPIAADR